MRSNKHVASPDPAGAAAATATVTWPVEWATQQFAVAGESAAVLFRGLESMRRIQAQAMQQVAERRTASAGRLRDGAAPDLLALQAGLLRQDLENATQCWQQLATTAAETCAELWANSMHLVNTEDAFGAAARLFRA